MFHGMLSRCSAITSTVPTARVAATVRATSSATSSSKHGSHSDDEHQHCTGIVHDRGDGEADGDIIECLASVPLLSRCSIAKSVSL